MGLFDKLKKDSANEKWDYAKKFKDAYENGTLRNVFDALDEWQKNGGGGDANCSFAVVITTQFNSLISLGDIKTLFLAAKDQDAANKELRSWFEATAHAVVKQKGIDI
ncbi:MAG: hypothetical protein IJL02_06220 [Methanobrevibacter sp.]|uniref:hypothetical protein n=1 Tax=Methanobrevibacter sp. TaxID=66852 RepID=UPI0025F1A489|nr:hypothetical protein [Methanobrevibacter sp.]MBQ6099444.1 hypothetical protein [Methanobrevibacter sp.]